jgi:hypothetical protein
MNNLTLYKSGNRGESITQLHERLALLGFEVPVAEHVDDRFGPGTEAAIRAFQATHGLAAHGSVDEATARGLGLGAAPGAIAGIVCKPDGAPIADVAVRLVQRAPEVTDRLVGDLDDDGRLLSVSLGEPRRTLAVPALLRPYLLALANGRASDAQLISRTASRRSGKPRDRYWLAHHVERLCMEAGVPVVCTQSLRWLHASVATEALAPQSQRYAVIPAIAHDGPASLQRFPTYLLVVMKVSQVGPLPSGPYEWIWQEHTRLYLNASVVQGGYSCDGPPSEHEFSSSLSAPSTKLGQRYSSSVVSL